MAGATKRSKDNDGDEPKKKAKHVAVSAPRRVTRQMTTDGPRRAVFATAELLEHILTFLPPKQIFGSARTCKQFRDVIASSVQLQEKLFLRAQPDNAKELWAQQYNWPRPLFSKVSSDMKRGNDLEAYVVPTRVNPLMCPGYLSPGVITGERTYQNVGIDSPPHRAYVRVSQSWHRMYLTVPPAKDVTFYIRFAVGGIKSTHVSGTVYKTCGLTWGDILQHAFEVEGLPNKRLFYANQVLPSILALKLGDALAALEGQTRATARIIDADILLAGMVVPTESEWENVHRSCGLSDNRNVDSESQREKECD